MKREWRIEEAGWTPFVRWRATGVEDGVAKTKINAPLPGASHLLLTDQLRPQKRDFFVAQVLGYTDNQHCVFGDIRSCRSCCESRL
ncbi:hypothetical protein CEXT_474451 [Caerostris extrusa]|uniref:Uncharacterized protein n=1 Tax=Caerostris extrusa TaxID=172846 RepID=A0AAV4UYE0_CAEEX|nr:hypothetical protein CEXT_474451 [Caerostris extrusa]